MGDRYRPARERDRPRPLAERMTFGNGGGGLPYDNPRPANAQGQQQNSSRSAHQSDFTFTSSHQGPKFPPTGPAADADSRSSRRPRRGRGGASASGNQRGGNPGHMRGNQLAAARSGPRGSQNGFRRGGFRKAAAHDRPLLMAQENGSPERALGVADGSNKFRNIEDLSDDSDSNSDSERSNGDVVKKKMARGLASSRADGDSVPKWSNPDPYTVAPPPDDSTGNKKDFVQMIRKAKNEAAEKAAANNAVSANDDFISFADLADDDDEDMEEELAPSVKPHIQGSLNDVVQLGGLGAKRSADAAGLPQRPERPGKANKRKRGDMESSLTSEWMPSSDSPATPWTVGIKYDYLKRDMEQWLHNEIMDFYDYVKPQERDNQIRKKLIDRIQGLLGPRLIPGHRGSVLCFGSFPAALYLPTADMDLVYATDYIARTGQPAIDLGNKRQANSTLRKAARSVERSLPALDMIVISRAKVPIIKFVDGKTGIHVDVSFENLSGIEAQATFQQWRKDFPLMVYMVALVKQFLVMRGLNDVHTGGLGGFTIICLVVSYFQHRCSSENLGRSFVEFLNYYGNEFDLAKKRIIMEPPAVVKKSAMGIDGRQEKADGLSIQDPNRPDNNISGGSHKAKQVFQAFSQAHKALNDRMIALSTGRTNDASVLEAVLGGNYECYAEHRHKMSLLR